MVNKKIMIWSLAGGIVVLFFLFIIFTGRTSVYSTGAATSSSKTIPNCKNVQIPYESQEEYLKTEYYTETVPYTDTECESKLLVYKVQKGSCVNREDNFFADDEPAKYSCTITNLDNEGGQFSMRIGFNVNGQQLEETQSRYIYPQSSETFRIERDASIQNCYCAENVPTKQVCRDVIKYQEIQRERQVTAYKPVTKYRTEQKCE